MLRNRRPELGKASISRLGAFQHAPVEEEEADIDAELMDILVRPGANGDDGERGGGNVRRGRAEERERERGT